MRLTKQEIKQRLIRLQNLKRLYSVAKERIEKLEKKTKEQNEIIGQLNEVVKMQAEVIENLKLRVEELAQMIFKKKKNKDKNDDGALSGNCQSSAKKHPRPADSYRKPIPDEDEITKTQEYCVFRCPDCHTRLIDPKTTVQYKMELAFLDQALKEVEKQIVHSGCCSKCKKRVAAIPISPQAVYFGESLKRFVCHATIILRLSISQTKDLLKTIANIDISPGEIATIQQEHSKLLTPEFERMKKQIQNDPAAHFDETTYKVFDQNAAGNYGWIMASGKTGDTVFALGKNREQGNALDLKGQNNPDQIGITDDYNAYKNIFGKKHQLCWAHLTRKFRDLAESKQLSENKREYCAKLHFSLKKIYKELACELEHPFDLASRHQAKKVLARRLAKLAKTNELDCAKLRTIRTTLAKNIDFYFTCLIHPDVPATNNKAEQLLRHIVIKRKTSFGCQTRKGADAMSVLFSVLLSLWRRSKENFFVEYRRLIEESRALRALPQ